MTLALFDLQTRTLFSNIHDSWRRKHTEKHLVEDSCPLAGSIEFNMTGRMNLPGMTGTGRADISGLGISIGRAVGLGDDFTFVGVVPIRLSKKSVYDPEGRNDTDDVRLNSLSRVFLTLLNSLSKNPNLCSKPVL